ncbi:MAG: hypothetical protein E7568_04630 [Ruminococcaceae bacterium]|nr:hypothetical protein [Oscillospiraceae bacterium]
MVKGVNKSVIEITDTGNKYFSKVILFVSPEYVEKKTRRLKNEAESVIKKLEITSTNVPLREVIMLEQKRRKQKILILSILGCILITAVVLLLVF